MHKEFTLEVPGFVARLLPPDKFSAFRGTKEFVDDALLKGIAFADYGREAEKHLKELRIIHNKEEIVGIDSWYPAEVLRLCRWSEPKEIDGHVERMFSCLLLLICPSLEEDDNSTLVQYLESVLVFGNDAIKRAGQFLIWKYNSIKVGSDRAFFALAVLIIVIKLDLLQSLDEEKSIVEWVNKVEESERDYEIDCGSYEHYTSSWLFGISLSDLKHDKWEDYLENISLPYSKINLRSAFEGRNIA